MDLFKNRYTENFLKTKLSTGLHSTIQLSANISAVKEKPSPSTLPIFPSQAIRHLGLVTFGPAVRGIISARCTEYEVNKGKLYGLRVYAKALKEFVSLSVWGIPWMEGQTSGSLTSLQTIQWMDAKFWSITGPDSSWNFALETASSILESPTVSQQTSESWLFISMRRLRLSTWSKRHARSKE